MSDTSDTSDGGSPAPDSSTEPVETVPPYEPDFSMIEILEKGADTTGMEERTKE